MQNNEQNERVRPKLGSAADLKKGGKAGKKSGSIGNKWAVTLVCLLVVLGAVIGGYFAAEHFRPVEEPEPETTYTSETVRIVERERTDLDRLTTYVNGEEQYTLISHLAEKAEAEDPDSVTEYEIDGQPYFTVDFSAAGQVAVYSYALTASKAIQMGAEDLAPYGLDDPQAQVLYRYHDGSEMVLNIGGKVPAGNYYYAALDDSHDVYMVYRTVYTACSNPVESLHVIPALAAVDGENIRDITIAQRGKETVQIQYVVGGDQQISIAALQLVQPIEYDAQSERASEVYTAAAAITIGSYAGHAETAAEKAAFGLDDPYAEISMVDANEVSAHFVIGDLLPGSDSVRYITVDDTGDIYTVDDSLLTFLPNANVSYLVDQFANLVYIKYVAGLEIITADTTYTATVEHFTETTSTGTERDTQTFTFEGEPADEDIFKDFYQVVIGTLFDKRIEDPAEYHLDGDAAVTVVYHLTYTDEPYVVEYVDYDRDYYAIRREGTTLFLIRKEKVNSMVETAELYRNGEYTGANDTVTY